jgi:hypothetical protein
MRRGEFIGNLIGTAVAWPLAAFAQQPAMPVIGFISSVEDSYTSERFAGIRRVLSEQGYVDGRNVRIEYRSAYGHYDRLPALAIELVSMRVTVIAAFSSSPAAIAAKAATLTIPIVFYLGVDPVERGLVASYNSPGGNLTAQSAQAHILSREATGFISGVLHPISGLDHVLAMVSVGVWGAQLGAPAIWILPLTFPIMMAFGGLIDFLGVPLPGTGIGSMVVLGGAVMLEARSPLPVVIAITLRDPPSLRAWDGAP